MVIYISQHVHWLKYEGYTILSSFWIKHNKKTIRLEESLADMRHNNYQKIEVTTWFRKKNKLVEITKLWGHEGFMSDISYMIYTDTTHTHMCISVCLHAQHKSDEVINCIKVRKSSTRQVRENLQSFYIYLGHAYGLLLHSFMNSCPVVFPHAITKIVSIVPPKPTYLVGQKKEKRPNLTSLQIKTFTIMLNAYRNVAFIEKSESRNEAK